MSTTARAVNEFGSFGLTGAEGWVYFPAAELVGSFTPSNDFGSAVVIELRRLFGPESPVASRNTF
jgi:hypothetical protein